MAEEPAVGSAEAAFHELVVDHAEARKKLLAMKASDERLIAECVEMDDDGGDDLKAKRKERIFLAVELSEQEARVAKLENEILRQTSIAVSGIQRETSIFVAKARSLTPDCHHRVERLMEVSAGLADIIAGQIENGPKMAIRISEIRLDPSLRQFGHQLSGGRLRKEGEHPDLSRT